MQLKLTISYKTISFISYYYQYPNKSLNAPYSVLLLKKKVLCKCFLFEKMGVIYTCTQVHVSYFKSYSDFLKISILIIYMIDERVTQKCFKRQHFSMATHFKSY